MRIEESDPGIGGLAPNPPFRMDGAYRLQDSGAQRNRGTVTQAPPAATSVPRAHSPTLADRSSKC
jgi:hypothetical protein